jgi:hypothetical protein
MTFAYIVRCRFTAPEREPAFNAWYSGPKIEQMLAQPFFRSCQRFRLASGAGRNYLALWTVESPEAFTTRVYQAQWGFSEWAPYITDWSRDLFDARHVGDAPLAVAPHGTLELVSFDGMNAQQAAAARTVIESAVPAMMWLPVAGLDRHTPLIGLLPHTAPPPARELAREQGAVQHGVYRPLGERYVARAIQNVRAD